MRPILLAAMASLLVTLGGTPFAIKLFRARGFGALIRDDIGHHAPKRGTPTMGGLVIMTGLLIGYLVAHVFAGFGRSGIIVLGAMAAGALVGFLDDFSKIRNQRSLGLNKKGKAVGQVVVGAAFALIAREWADAPTALSFVRQTALHLGPVLFAIWVVLMFAASTNGVNLTDGLDGLAAGSGALVFASYVVIAFWQFRHPCPAGGPGCYGGIPDPLDLAIIAAAGLGACAGFLWWNAAPAKIFMGDTGALALGAAFASLAVMTGTQLLLVILGGLYVLETTSVLTQVVAFRGFRRRVFRTAPLHHHFELGGWPEFTVIVRFWIIAGLSAALGLGLFYAEFLARGGVT